MRILAVDVGSNIVGLAYFEREGARPQTAVLRAPQGTDSAPTGWLDHWEYFEARIRDRSILWAPDVIAIEDVVGHRFTQNVGAVIKLAKTWGWLVHVLRCEYAGADWLELSTATIKVALGLRPNADRRTRQAAARALFPGVTQDEADAAAVGMTAYREISKREAVTA